MDETLRQVGELLLGSIPTIIFMVLLYGIYTVLVHKPLVKVLAERRGKTEGAVEKARADIAAAEARTAEYEQRLREARMTVFKNQEALRQQALQARAAAVAEARNKAQGGGLVYPEIRRLDAPIFFWPENNSQNSQNSHPLHAH